jgi:hypothetical protein
MLRITGKVVRLDARSGHSPDKVTGELKPWAFDIITVLVAEQAVVNVQKFASNTTPTPPVGAEVDVAVDVDVFRGTPSYQLVKPWADLFPKLASVPAPARTGS